MSNYNSTLQSNNTDLQAILNAINELPEAGTQATPVISLNSSTGLVTATAGTKSSTYQLAFQAAKTITPTTTSQTAVSSGYYTGGKITVAAIPSSYIIPSGTKTITANGIYDVKSYASAIVNVSGGSGGNTYIEDAFVTRTLTSYENDRVATIGNYAFYNYSNLTSISFPNCTTIGGDAFGYCSNLTYVSFPNCTTIGSAAFGYCSNLTSVSFPNCTTISRYAFDGCRSLTSISFPNCTTIGSAAFDGCRSLTSISFPNCTNIGSYAFSYCTSLTTIYLLSSSRCTLGNSTAFSNCSALTSIYVPTSLVDAYKSATNWTYFSSKIVGYGVPNEDEGNVPGKTISFTIDGTEYQAEEGMTWGEWVDSAYNIDGFNEDGGLIIDPNWIGTVNDENSNPVNSSDVIINGAVYSY